VLARVRQSPKMAGANLVGEVSTPQPYTVRADGEHKLTVAALDLGIKRNTPRRMAARGITTHVLPAASTVADVLATNPDAVFLSNGPGDPATADHEVAVTRALLERGTPVFGICFGNQILGRALGLGTYKLKYGHRGINQPVLDSRTGTVEVTAHNHGFAIDAPLDGRFPTDFGAAEVSHVCLNDNVVEGLRCLDAKAFSVQYHPEAAAGPHDADYLFDRLVELVHSA
jgi:carbamoyl-phosphate synthase small subunit